MIGIYKIENLINGKVYIGQSIDIKRRFRAHKNNYKKINYLESNKPLYRSMRKYGIENFSFEIIQICNIKSLNILEKYYINLYNSNDLTIGYNLNLDDSLITLTKLKKSEVIEIIDLLKTDILKSEICKKFNISIQFLNLINNGKSLRKDDIIYPIRIKTDIDLKKKKLVECQVCNTLTKNKKFCSLECSHYSQRKVIDRPSNNELQKLMETMTCKDISRLYNVNDNIVRKWLKNNNSVNKNLIK